MKKKVLILGAKGMLGKELVKVFYRDGNYDVQAWDKENLDLLNKRAVKDNITLAKPDLIINCVAFNDVDAAEKDEKAFIMAKELNGEVPGFLAELAKGLDATFIQFVTDYIFDGEKGEYTEDDKTSPISNYGISKVLGEKNVKAVGEKFYLVRISKLFGNPGISDEAKKSFFSIMLELARDRNELKVVDDERSCFTYVVDLAEATKKLFEKKYAYGIYHLVNEKPVTWYKGVLKLFEIAKIKNVKVFPVGADEFPRPAKRASSTVLVNTKFPKLRSYEEAIKEWLAEKGD
ncbi:NAD(P)-dependent oxidoreductase [bacterium]|jgi:dTDP-4-dehydrorhamnose reductase|nr:NAD(P)-dependent oxidoreductase [bacterium]MBT4250837.1 NAD(P)-dependent oxidoreductase [bacterium]MBT4597549.1 NAD(P)-dependent oxidoreductase [bacterium]MBT6754015.1 NAD(P)-dependent oxidoreductase [bacterium]MBT7038045.1 NAD(P)-dependent oxidoreductase [bacterium]